MAVKTVSAHDVQRLRQDGKPIHLIDVRTPDEYAEVHAEGARLVPLDQLDPHAVMSANNGSTEAPLYMICKSGGRAAKAVEKFQAAGFTNVFSVETVALGSVPSEMARRRVVMRARESSAIT